MQRRAFPEALSSRLDFSSLETICLSTAERSEQKLKYADVQDRLRRAWKDIVRLDLQEPPFLDILDLGCGPGYFLYACQSLGHRCVGLDRPDLEFWGAISKWLGVTAIVTHAILPRYPLPQLGRFDLVTAYRLSFNYVQDENRLWTLDEWAFFLDDLRDNVLRKDGRFVMKLTKQHDKGSGPQWGCPSFGGLLTQRGAKLKGTSTIVFDPLL